MSYVCDEIGRICLNSWVVFVLKRPEIAERYSSTSRLVSTLLFATSVSPLISILLRPVLIFDLFGEPGPRFGTDAERESVRAPAFSVEITPRRKRMVDEDRARCARRDSGALSDF